MLFTIFCINMSQPALSQYQSGFYRGDSTSLQLTRIVQELYTQRHQRRHQGLCFFDLAKAFDSVWHRGLIAKLRSCYRRIITKAIITRVSSDIAAAVVPHQLCVGNPSACEAATISVQSQYFSVETEAILLIDASKAFNAINRKAALHNISHLCPPMANFIANTYGAPIPLLLSGGGMI